VSDDPQERFERLFDDHFDAVLRFALARAAPDVAQDATAETFLAAWRSLETVPEEPRGWLLAVVRRKLVDQYRSTGRHDAVVALLESLAHLHEPDLAERVVEHDRVRRALATLNPADQEILRLVAWDGLSQDEAARVLGHSLPLFRVRLHRARRRLRAELLAAGDPSIRRETGKILNAQEPI
jgi:RNA polymerase sigma-70 factor (ECF subfamily)